MSEGLFTVELDGSLVVDKREGQRAAALDEVLSTFAEPIHTTAFESHYRVTSASIWKARRQGLSLEDIIHALKTYCETDLPASLLADVELWSQQIDRLWLETDQGRLVLRSHQPLLIPAVQRHRTLRRYVKRKIDISTLELRAETEPDLIQAFDDAQYPVLDRRRGEPAVPRPHRPGANAVSVEQRRHRRRARKRSSRETEQTKLTAPIRSPRASVRTDDLFDVFRSQLANRCQATTRSGRQCKNRVRPPGVYCRVHMELNALELGDIQTASYDSFKQLLDLGLVTVEQMALFRVGIGVVIGLSTWLLNMLFMWIGAGWFGLPLASWYTAPIAFLLTCWLMSKLVFEGRLRTSLLLLLISLLSILMDFFNKEGLILNICFVLIPFALPLYLLYRYSLSGWWSLLLVPAALFIGRVFYQILDTSPE